MKVMRTSEIEQKERGGGLFKGRVTVQPVLDSDTSELCGWVPDESFQNGWVVPVTDDAAATKAKADYAKHLEIQAASVVRPAPEVLSES